MKQKFNVGDEVYYVSSSIYIKKAKVIRASAGFCTIKFDDENGGIRVRETKLYSTEQQAKIVVRDNKARHL